MAGLLIILVAALGSVWQDVQTLKEISKQNRERGISNRDVFRDLLGQSEARVEKDLREEVRRVEQRMNFTAQSILDLHKLIREDIRALDSKIHKECR